MLIFLKNTEESLSLDSIKKWNLVWTLGKRNESSGPGALTYCSNEDGRASPDMKRRSFYPRVQGHNSSVVRSHVV